MSWAVSAIGRKQALRAAVADQFVAARPLKEIEESIAKLAALAIDEVISAQENERVVLRVIASGRVIEMQNRVAYELKLAVEPLAMFAG